MIVMVPKGPELVAAILACGLAGGAVAPIDVSIPERRFDFILRDSNAQAVITLGD